MIKKLAFFAHFLNIKKYVLLPSLFLTACLYCVFELEESPIEAVVDLGQPIPLCTPIIKLAFFAHFLNIKKYVSKNFAIIINNYEFYLAKA